MIDSSKIGQMSDDELLSMQRVNSPGNQSREAAKTELEFRNAKRLVESTSRLAHIAESTEQSTKRMTEFAARTETSSKRMEFATWVILIATVAQLALVAVPMLHERHGSAAVPVKEENPVVSSEESAPAKVEQVDTDTKTWSNAEVTVTCSNARLLPWTSLDGKSKQVTLDCTMKNVSDKAVPLVDANKVDALFLLHDGRVMRGRAYLGSKDHEIPAHGEIEGGLFPGGDNECAVKQSDSDCVRAELKDSGELLLTDTVNGARYHVLVK